MGKYLVLCQIGGAGDPVIYRAGAVLTVPGDMSVEGAEAHARAGNLRPVDDTPAPAASIEAPVIHAAPVVTPVETPPEPAATKPSKSTKKGGD